MLAKTYSGTTLGLDGVLITIEVDVASKGFPTFTIVGLPSKEIQESKERIRTALTNMGFAVPDSRLTVNLAPADIPKNTSRFDLPIALGILAACGVIAPEAMHHFLCVGELSLEGKIQPVNGIIPLALLAKSIQKKGIFVPVKNASEASYVHGIQIYPANNLQEIVHHLNKTKHINQYNNNAAYTQIPATKHMFDFADIVGQETAKRVLEIAAAGFHNTHLRGSPGAGKTLLSKSFPSILPPLDQEEIMEVGKIYSIAGLFQGAQTIAHRPFRSPHHTTSKVGLIGGGSSPSPGEISLAHRGVLFLDEFPEFDRVSLEALRQPLEDGIVTISRAAGTLTFPARFLLLAASNPCPCGYLGHPKRVCHCGQSVIYKYQKRISGPMLDRIDIHIDVPPVDESKLIQQPQNEPSEKIQARVINARTIQKNRLIHRQKLTNGEMSSKDVKELCRISNDAQKLLQLATEKLSISARSYFKIVKVAQTIADLASSPTIESIHMSESLQYRAKSAHV